MGGVNVNVSDPPPGTISPCDPAASAAPPLRSRNARLCGIFPLFVNVIVYAAPALAVSVLRLNLLSVAMIDGGPVGAGVSTTAVPVEPHPRCQRLSSFRQTNR